MTRKIISDGTLLNNVRYIENCIDNHDFHMLYLSLGNEFYLMKCSSNKNTVKLAHCLKKDILQKLRNEVKNLTSAQSSIVDYIKNSTESAFLTIEQLAREVGTSTTTIMRLAGNVGYKGYVEFQKDMFVADYLLSAVSFRLPVETSTRLGEVEEIQRGMSYHPAGDNY